MKLGPAPERDSDPSLIDGVFIPRFVFTAKLLSCQTLLADPCAASPSGPQPRLDNFTTTTDPLI